eukprot:CAMPEP_0178396262 /NCGR_PEP_ID=MMETSP0689_2-20121128/13640_1 /TAXON_ID=160604 /ORGANISM="Amphidinium massartii, Strain CS-259" /LENGTH=583 /DNA_ID=CAMNT_0020016935 /DNA_START=183 /DNA_END=1931 /DNA_ORIENTATION=+
MVVAFAEETSIRLILQKVASELHEDDVPDEACSPTFSLALRHRSMSSRLPDLFRGAPVCRVLDGAASVFTTRDQEIHSGWQKLQQSSASEDSASDNEHEHADHMFYSTRPVQQVDFFISHVWDAPRWQKALALYYYANCRKACYACASSWLLAAAFLCLQDGITGYGGEMNKLLLYLGVLPLAVFFITFFTAHHFSMEGGATVWLDKLCVHQTRTELRSAGIAALPEFVANSDRMLILQSKTYFERLWCNLEVATFCALSGASHVDFVPLWFAPSVLSIIILNFVAMVLTMHFAVIVPMWGTMVEAHLGASPFTPYVTFIFGCGALVGVSYAPVTILVHWAMRRHMQERSSIRRQMQEFKLEQAKCTEESDRAVIEAQVARIFEDHPHLGIPPGSAHVGPISRFNYYINNDFHDEVERSLGGVLTFRFSTALVMVLPMYWVWLVNVLSCDGLDCDEAAVAEGYETTSAYMICNAASWMVYNIFAITGIYPATLRSLSCMSVGDSVEEHALLAIAKYFAGLLVVLGQHMLAGMKYGFFQAALSLTIIDPQPLNWVALILASIAPVVHWFFLFELHKVKCFGRAP